MSTSSLRRAMLCFVVAAVWFSSVGAQDDAVKAALKPVHERFALDRRTAVFDVLWESLPDALVLRGEVDNPAARAEAVAAVRRIAGIKVLDSITVLPNAALGEKTYGIVTLSVGNVRSKPGEAEELATQVLMGSVVKILKKKGGYFYIQSPDQYLGWLDDDALVAATRAGVDAWAAARKVIVTGFFGFVRDRPAVDAQPVCDVVIGGLLKFAGTQDAWTSVELADGRKGFIESSLVQDYETWKTTVRATPASIEKTARMFVGIPYLWGGTSAKAMDCSGFTKIVYRMNGIELNRDADQQAAMGTQVALTDDFRNVRKGDLLFFGRKASTDKPEHITHVGIYLENKMFIHSSGRVHFGSFDPASPYYDEYNLKRLVRVRRVLPSGDIPEVHQQ